MRGDKLTMESIATIIVIVAVVSVALGLIVWANVRAYTPPHQEGTPQ